MKTETQLQPKPQSTLFTDNSPNDIGRAIRQKLQLLRTPSHEQQSSSTQYLYACAATEHTIKVYWRHRQAGAEKILPLPRLILDEPLGNLDFETQQIADFLGAALASLDVISAGYYLGELYTTLLPEDLRAKYGIFYTPPALTERLLALATEAGINWGTAHVLDPACGGGAFLTPVALKMIDALSSKNAGEILAHITTHLRGFELDPFSGWMSQVLLETALIDLCRKANKRLPKVVVLGDALTMPPEGKEVDLVIGNPPYGRLSLSAELRTRYQRSLYGHANAYGVFMEVAVRWARPGGIIAYITPTGFLGGKYFKHLRSLMAQEAPPVAIDLVTSRKGVFSDVLQETLLATYKRGTTVQKPKVHILKLVSESRIQLESTGNFELPHKPSGPWLIPRNNSQSLLITKLRVMPCRLRDYGYKVSTGPLVWNRHKAQLSNESTKGSFPIIWSECVTKNGDFEYRAQKKNHLLFVKPSDNQQWLLTKTTCVLVHRTTAKEQRRRLIAAQLPIDFIRKYGAVSVENHLNMIKPIQETPLVSLRAIAALMNSQIVDSAFRCISGSVAVSATELEALPLPSLQDIRHLDQLLDSEVPLEEVENFITALYLQEHTNESAALINSNR